MIIKPLLIMVFGLLPFLGTSQTKTILENDLQELATQLSEEQLARLVNYAEKLLQEPKDEEVVSSAKQKVERPNIFWKASKYNLGNVTQGDVLFLPFKFVNTSKIPYFMTNLKSSCGCVTVKLPEDPIEQNESGILTLNVNTQGLEGQTHITVLIYDNSSPSGKSYLSIDADVLNPASAKN